MVSLTAFRAEVDPAMRTLESLTVVFPFESHHELTGFVRTHDHGLSTHNQSILQDFKVLFLEGSGVFVFEKSEGKRLFEGETAFEVRASHGGCGVVVDGSSDDATDTPLAEDVGAFQLN